jgi:hypothetical protein
MQATPTKPSLETCAQLICAAKKQMDEARNNGDQEEFECARTAFLRAHESAKRHGHAPSEMRDTCKEIKF